MSAGVPMQVRSSQSVSDEDAEEGLALKDEEEAFLPSFNGKPIGSIPIPAWTFNNRFPHKIVSQRKWYSGIIIVVILIMFMAFGGSKHLSKKDVGLQPLTETRISPLPWCWSCNSERRAVQHKALAKPKTMPIVGVVFYGRRMTASILQCYLRVRYIL